MPVPTNVLAGLRILLVEDDYLIVDEMAREFSSQGAEIIGPVARVQDALELIAETDRIDAAVLDINLRGEMAFPVADALIARGVPFVFATGYDDATIPQPYAKIKRCEKPVDPLKIAAALFSQI